MIWVLGFSSCEITLIIILSHSNITIIYFFLFVYITNTITWLVITLSSYILYVCIAIVIYITDIIGGPFECLNDYSEKVNFQKHIWYFIRYLKIEFWMIG